MRQCSFRSVLPENLLAAIDGDQVRHHLPCHGQHGPIGILFLLLAVIEIMAKAGLFGGAILAASIRMVWICRLRCFDSGVRWMSLPRTPLCSAQPAVADGLFDRRKAPYV
jgi:hypothetical protein